VPISRSRRRGEIVGLRLGRQFEAQLSVLAFFVPPAMSAHRSSPCSLWGYDGKVNPKDRETFNPSLEGLRGLAALAVCAHHGMSAFSDGSTPTILGWLLYAFEKTSSFRSGSPKESLRTKEWKMAVSTCIKCSGHSFELALFTPLGDSRKLTIVQCSMCGTPVGVMDPAIGPQIEALKSQIAAIDERLNRIAKALQD
jgi:hypothetical protein